MNIYTANQIIGAKPSMARTEFEFEGRIYELAKHIGGTPSYFWWCVRLRMARAKWRVFDVRELWDALEVDRLDPDVWIGLLEDFGVFGDRLVLGFVASHLELVGIRPVLEAKFEGDN